MSACAFRQRRFRRSKTSSCWPTRRRERQPTSKPMTNFFDDVDVDDRSLPLTLQGALMSTRRLRSSQSENYSEISGSTQYFQPTVMFRNVRSTHLGGQRTLMLMISFFVDVDGGDGNDLNLGLPVLGMTHSIRFGQVLERFRSPATISTDLQTSPEVRCRGLTSRCRQ